MNPASTTALLHDYGPWAVVAICLVAIVGLWVELLKERKRRDADNQGHVLQIIEMVRQSAERESTFVEALRNIRAIAGRISSGKLTESGE